MKSGESVPEVCIHSSPAHHCWCVVLGSHEVPICDGRYAEDVEPAIVAKEIRTRALGPVKVKVV